ncbi:MAG: PadR family transcriptional regulator [Gemmatimonadota bacterium]
MSVTTHAGDFLPLHPLEFRILLVLLEGSSHGYQIVRAIEAGEPGAAIYPANLYRRIRDLLARGLLREADAPRGEDPEGRRRYVAVTPMGRRVARAEAERLQALVRDARAADLLGSA